MFLCHPLSWPTVATRIFSPCPSGSLAGSLMLTIFLRTPRSASRLRFMGVCSDADGFLLCLPGFGGDWASEPGAPSPGSTMEGDLLWGSQQQGSQTLGDAGFGPQRLRRDHGESAAEDDPAARAGGPRAQRQKADLAFDGKAGGEELQAGRGLPRALGSGASTFPCPAWLNILEPWGGVGGRVSQLAMPGREREPAPSSPWVGLGRQTPPAPPSLWRMRTQQSGTPTASTRPRRHDPLGIALIVAAPSHLASRHCGRVSRCRV